MDSRRIDENPAARCWEQLRDGIISSRMRKQAVLEWLRENPDTYQGLTRRGFFTSYATAQRVVSKAAKKGEIKCVGTVRGDDGRPAYVFCGWRPSAIEHDVLVTDIRAAYVELSFERGQQLERSADAIFWNGNKKYYLEFFTGKQTLNQIRHRFEKCYGDAEHPIAVYALTRGRLDSIRCVAESVGKLALFGVVSEVIANPWGESYETIGGVRVPLNYPYQ